MFIGPTRLKTIPPQTDILEPAALGSVFRAVEAGYKIICIVDGHFGNIPSVWHKEILFALKGGVQVCGSSSMGALRAAELYAFGMAGFGWVYRAFRRGVLQDDDEVCVLHAVPELNFHALSEAMVNVRYSLRKMRHHRHLSREAEIRIASAMKQLHFSKRNMVALRSAFEDEFGPDGSAKFDLYEKMKIDIKMLDADLMLRAVSTSPIVRNDDWKFPMTNHWMQQFILQNGDIPQLRTWRPAQQN